MTVTNEPGFYEAGKFGIRIENVLIVREVSTPYNYDGEKYLGFEPVTLAPLCKNLLSVALLSHEEIAWINEYHERVLRELSPGLSDDPLAFEWLKRETSPI